MKSFLIRGLEEELLEEIKKRAKKESISANKYIKSIIRSAVGLGKFEKKENKFTDLDLLAGRWDEEEYRLINIELKGQRKIDKDLWN